MTSFFALQVLRDLLGDGPQWTPEIRRKAVKLSIEALDRHQNRHTNTFAGMMLPLPSEESPKPLHALGFNTGDDESP